MTAGDRIAAVGTLAAASVVVWAWLRWCNPRVEGPDDPEGDRP